MGVFIQPKTDTELGWFTPKVLTLFAGCLAALSPTWWLIPLSKWVITPVISGLTLLIPFITGVKTHLRFVGSSPPSSDSYPSVTHGDFPIEMDFFQWDDHRSMQLQ